MRIEVPIKEVQEFLSDYYHININFRNTEMDKIRVKYYVSAILMIKDIKKDEIVFGYKMNLFVNLITRGAHYFLRKKLVQLPVEWDSKTKEIAVKLRRIPQLNELLKFIYIAGLHFVQDDIRLVMYANEKNNIS